MKIELSEVQKLAVETVGKNVCVSAGAGSGKTGVLVERFVHLVKNHGLSPAQILAITFTEKAANEMKRRIVDRLREEKLEEARREIENAAIGTIHSFAARVLREHPIEAGIDPHFVIFEAEEAARLKDEVLDEMIETQVSDAEVFNFLRIYGEESVRKGILEVYQRTRNSETPFEVILRRRAKASREFFEAELGQALEKISDVKGTAEVSGELARLFREKEFEEEAIDQIMALKSRLRAAGEQKGAIRRVQEALLDFANFLREEKSLPLREVFIRLALQFEKGYNEAKAAERALDFDDLQLRAVRLLGSDSPASKALRKIYQEKFREILVDEFQDTNRLQDRLLEWVRRESNLFVVGDLKQSIYSFRGTQVEVFLEREKAFSQSKTGVRLSLADNYRSRPELIDFVNRFFEILWKEDKLPFEPLQALRPSEGKRQRIERLALEKTKEESSDEVRIREARSLAAHIKRLADDEGVPYRDIACLFEAMSDVHFYEQEFRRAGIPYFVVSNRGFYSQPEIRDVVSFLSALENPKRDVPLAATLRSPLFQISDETLFWLALSAKKGSEKTPLVEGVHDFESLAEISEAEKGKLRFFKETFDRFLAEKEKFRTSEVVEKILRLTGYDLYVLKLRQGLRAHANLRKLVEIAREMESKEPLHLGDFVRAVKGLETREVRESQAQVEAEAGEVVRLMSIHIAKGLEFPVVILPDLGRRDVSEGGDFSVSEEEGLGIRDTLTFSRNKKRMDRVRSEESKRLLYVAMTRAKERLILSGPVNEKKPEGSFHEMSTWADWVERILSEGNWEVNRLEEVPPRPFPFERRKGLADRKSIRSRLEGLSPVRLREIPPEVDSLLENIQRPEKVEFQRIDLPVSAFLLFAKDPEAYFAIYELGVPTALERWESPEVKEEEPPLEEVGAGFKPAPTSAAEFGTRVHQILEQVLIRHTSESAVESMVLAMNQDLGQKERDEISGIVRRFIKSQEAREILRSPSVHAELPFVLRLPYGLIHGTLDLVYQNRAGEWVVLDYKTSEVDVETFAARGEEYRIQLELYALAVWKILGQEPAEARIHFLRPGLTHRIPFGPNDLGKLMEKFTRLQKEVLEFRRSKLQEV